MKKIYTRTSDGVTVSVTDDEDTLLMVVAEAPLGFLHFTWLTKQTGFLNEKVGAILESLAEKGLISGFRAPTLREQALN